MVTFTADGLDELAGDRAQRLVAEDLDGAVVRLEGVVEGELVVVEANVVSARIVIQSLSTVSDFVRLSVQRKCPPGWSLLGR